MFMDTLTAIFTRRSTRHFEDRPIEDDKLRTILEAAMSGPSCVNSKDWAFIVVTERETLDKMAEANGRPAQPLKEAAAGILVCGDMERAFERAKDYWIIDGAIAAENISICAQALGIGAVISSLGYPNAIIECGTMLSGRLKSSFCFYYL